MGDPPRVSLIGRAHYYPELRAPRFENETFLRCGDFARSVGSVPQHPPVRR